MTAISQFFDKQVAVKRLTGTAGTDNEAYGDHLSEVSCQIQPLEDSYGEDLEGSYGKDFVMFCEVLNIKQGDKIVDGTVEYLVVGLESYSWQGFSHMELRIRQTK